MNEQTLLRYTMSAPTAPPAPPAAAAAPATSTNTNTNTNGAPVPQMVDNLENVLQIVRSLRPCAGDRSAQDPQPSSSSSSSGSSCAADGGTVGGRAIAGVDAACALLRCLWQGVDLRVDAVHEVYWMLEGTRHTQRTRPTGFTASPGRYIKYWARLRRLHLWSSL